MLSVFIGPPCSGKTTTAARLFADLKEQGLPASFLAEYARSYIAEQRYFQKSAFRGLQAEDQVKIFRAQAHQEAVLASDRDAVVIADSAALNSLLYMPDEIATSHQQEAMEAATRYDLIFLCPPVKPGVMYDPNRIHSFEQSVELEKRIDYILRLAHVNTTKVHRLYGETRFRVAEACSKVMWKYMDLLKAAK